jgi:LuxR family transcriptional regulator, quorum-sensing system regulator BjaR1
MAQGGSTGSDGDRTRKLGAAVLDYAEDIQSMDDPGPIAGKMERLLAGYGIEYFAIANFSRSASEFAKGILAARLNVEWTRHFYESGQADNNPLLMGAVACDVPLCWSEIAASYDGGRYAGVFADAAAFGINEGMSIVIDHPGRRRAIAYFSGRHVDTSPPARLALHAATLFTHGRLAGLNAVRAGVPPALSRREAECLSWVAQGKSDWDIGEILGIGESTVHGYVEAAKRKLGVATRMQAVVGAIRTGTIMV